VSVNPFAVFIAILTTIFILPFMIAIFFPILIV